MLIGWVGGFVPAGQTFGVRRVNKLIARVSEHKFLVLKLCYNKASITERQEMTWSCERHSLPFDLGT